MDPIIETTSLLTPRLRNKPTEARDAIAVDRIVLRNDLRLYIREAWHSRRRRNGVVRLARSARQRRRTGGTRWNRFGVYYTEKARVAGAISSSGKRYSDSNRTLPTQT
jgi:hypothetical protein